MPLLKEPVVANAIHPRASSLTLGKNDKMSSSGVYTSPRQVGRRPSDADFAVAGIVEITERSKETQLTFVTYRESGRCRLSEIGLPRTDFSLPSVIARIRPCPSIAAQLA